MSWGRLTVAELYANESHTHLHIIFFLQIRVNYDIMELWQDK